MYSFEGDFRRKPQQNLGGASSQRTERDALILQVQQQRQKREEHRKRLNSTIKIQAFTRSYLTRKHCKQYERDDFDNIFPSVNSDDIQTISKLVAKLLFFFDDKKDLNRLVSISQFMLKQQHYSWKKLFQNAGSCIQIRRLLFLHLRLLRTNTEMSLAVPLRMFEVFTSTNSTDLSVDGEYIVGNTLLYLVKRGYFQDLCVLLSQRTPPLYGPSPNPPTPLCGALIDLIQRPLAMVSRVEISQYDRSALQHVARCASSCRGVSLAYTILNKVLELVAGGATLGFQWIPSHVNIVGNEVADALAREALSNGTKVFVKPDYSELLHKYRRGIRSKWKEYFDIASREKGIWYRTMQSEPPHIPWFNNAGISRKLIVIAHRLRSGHMPLNNFKFLMKKIDTPNCDTCGVVEDVYHLLTECVRSQSMREELYRALKVNQIDVGLFQSVLAEQTSDSANMLYRSTYDLLREDDFDTIMTEFASAFLCTPHAEPIEMFIIPALAQSAAQRFPFLALIRCLRDDTKFHCRKLLNDSWLLYSVLSLEPTGFVNDILTIDNTRLPNNPIMLEYLKVIAKLTVNVCNKKISYEYEDSLYSQETAADKDDESDDEVEPNPTSVREQTLLTKCIELLNEPERVVMTTCSMITETALSEEFLDCVSEICHNLLLSHRMALHKYRLLYTLAFKPVFLRGLWRWLTSMSHESSFGGSVTPLLSALSRGMGADTTVIPVNRLLAPLAVFCSLFDLLIGTLHDTEFCRDVEDEEELGLASGPSSLISAGGRTHAFEFAELGALCRALRAVCLGLVELAYPETRSSAIGQYKDAVGNAIDDEAKKQTPAWSHLFKVVTHLMRALYVRDARLQFCGASSWPVEGVVSEGAGGVLAVSRAHRASRHGHAYSHHSLPTPPRQSQEDGPPLTVKELRAEIILKEIPFIVPFSTRVLMFQSLLAKEKIDHWYELTNFNEGPSINISVRRTHLYEDAFDKLSYYNEPDIKLKLRVQLINQVGAEEAGVDGGGLFREFLSELLKSAFDPNRGLFRLTKDNMLYPNPAVQLLYDDFSLHYFFVGRMLGKALYENLLVELPLAEFFLGKLCSSRETGVHALASLDPALYRGLLQLKTHRRQDVPELNLDFTIISDELGEQKVEELKAGGTNIPVTAENRIEYIHLVADYKLNRQIRLQCVAFKRGLTSVINIDWLRMFSCRELQLLISGAEVPIDLVDLKAHTLYGGGFHATHATVQLFWNVVENFDDVQRRQLLKFVTSCSRPPLLGFKDLQPPFCIQSAGPVERLPSSSTCMNLLKLPEFPSEELLAEKLLYAIQSGAGFELS